MAKKKLKKKSKILLIGLVAVCVAIVAAVAVYFSHGSKKEEAASPSPSAVTYLNDTKDPDGDYKLDDATVQSLRDELNTDQQANGDVKAIFYFESGLVHKPLMQTGDYYYLNHSWQTKEEESAKDCVTLDPENDLNNDDMNLHIAGHYWYNYQERDAADYGFTPLVNLQDQSNYDANKYVTLVTPTEIRYYQIAYVVNCPLDKDGDTYYPPENLQYNLITYDSNYFNNYIQAVKKNEYYDTGVSVEYGDRLMTMETCVENEEDHREIVIAKELGRTQF